MSRPTVGAHRPTSDSSSANKVLCSALRLCSIRGPALASPCRFGFASEDDVSTKDAPKNRRNLFTSKHLSPFPVFLDSVICTKPLAYQSLHVMVVGVLICHWGRSSVGEQGKPKHSIEKFFLRRGIRLKGRLRTGAILFWIAAPNGDRNGP